MTYVDGFSGALAVIGQIQDTLSSLPEAASSGGFEAVLQQISSISGLGGSSGTAAPDLSGSYGWPLEEGDQLGSPNDTTAPSAFNSSAYELDPVGQTEAASSPVTDLAAPAAGASVSNGGTPSSGAATGQGLGQSAVSAAEKFLGVPYLWGGTDPAQGVDCSGLVQDVFAKLGINLPRTSQEQATAGVPVAGLADAQPGDLVFFPGSDGTAAAPGHVGIYIGNGEMIDAPHTGAQVRIDPVGDPTAIRRVTGDVTSAAPGPTTGTAFESAFTQAAAAYGVPSKLLSAVASTESAYQPGAVSSAGAEGLMQLMPSTASSLSVDPFVPTQAVNGAAKLLSSYYSQYGSWPLALAAYNAGPAAVQEYSGVPPYPQTQAYVQTVLSRAGMESS